MGLGRSWDARQQCIPHVHTREDPGLGLRQQNWWEQAQAFTHQTGVLQSTCLGLSGIPFHCFLTVYFFFFFKEPKTYKYFPPYPHWFLAGTVALNQTHVAIPSNKGVFCQSREFYIPTRKKQGFCVFGTKVHCDILLWVWSSGAWFYTAGIFIYL